ncbi:MAG: pyridoxal phosphate-dependent aminotransferase [Oscillospiraceae bacterium]|nr:pyridoxal phosphate-dependent aminotransferase [Oscillospiraceae bacterium]
MIDPKLIAWGSSGSTIRSIAEYGAKRAAVVGAENVYNFSIGSPSVDPPACVQESIDRLNATVPATQLHTYAPAPGLQPVRQHVADYLKAQFGVPYRDKDIYMTCGTSTALAVLCRVFLSEGDEAVVPAPFFMEYRVYVEAVGGKLVVVPPQEKTLQLDMTAMEAAITEKTRLVLLNSPNNPSGGILTRSVLTALAAMLERKQKQYGHPIYIVADEPYRELCYNAEVPFIPSLYKNTVYCYSLSKSVSLPGDRVGFLALHPAMDDYDNVFAAVYGAVRIYGYICLSPLLQLMLKDCLGETADLSAYEENRDLIYGSLTKLGYECVHPDGAFYLFLKTPGGDANAFCKRAMEQYDLLLVPGDEFGCEGYARLAYCVPKDMILRSLPAFEKLAKEYGL